MLQSIGKNQLKKFLRWAGTLIAVGAIIFVGSRLWEFGGKVDFERFESSDWLVIALSSVIYGAANLLLGYGWGCILLRFDKSVSFHWAQRVYGISQLAKYMPGNIFQFAGRQAMAMAGGVDGFLLAKSVGWELSLLSLSGALFGIVVVSIFFPAIPYWLLLFFLGLAILLVSIFLNHLFDRHISNAFRAYSAFLAVSGSLFVVVLELVSDGYPTQSEIPWIPVCGAYILAWLAGLVTPGSPAGLGVREVVLLYLVGGIVNEPALILAVLIGRMVTILGDILYFLSSYFIGGKE
ncbi:MULTISPECIES: hypothetical protein [Halomonadaceae]|uniref:Flippase-like domain-containing protein n=1 Tax=Vreelandella halophila TaxID=86177 RepID=A0A9X5B4N5_9GAMM|nr:MULTISPECIES: hypothetical protein [Halomonas]MYL25272.1 hypothetical protein [Halomonas utahensis]MYL75334.1 hypothetical protein [Halomonas sp. 22501_18_FS]